MNFTSNRIVKNTVLLLSLLFSFLIIAKAQNVTSEYSIAIGLKSLPGGISFKQFISKNNALEGILYFDKDVTRVSALYEFYYDIPSSIEGLKWFIGPGIHAGNWTNRYKANNPNISGNKTLGIGLDAIIGIDYKIDALPFDISFDWQPSINLNSNAYFNEGVTWGGVAIRYTIK